MNDYDDETLRVSGEVTPVSTPSSGAIDHGRFVPGALVGSRYRIVALLGKGGMGEVYRADDLLLGQPVALKFLPQRIANNPNALARLLAEVRIARQISHPNVCRVYDAGEVDGEHFISMEYVLGEDLRSLLHRIGRFGPDKGMQIARQICAGLAAAHDRGVLHRDLKPANVMIDERGVARITDFGLAVLADSAEAQQREGTPAYMAPEQLEGEEVTTRSDIYSLGLVLYEIFSGRMLFDAKTITELIELRRSTTARSIRLTNDIDPLVERVIQRCLAEDPQQRPKTATSVAAALPGGDPLAAALAAGETPSPELLAEAGAHEGLDPRRAFIAIGAFLALLAIVLVTKNRSDLIVRAGVHEPPEVMAAHGRDMLARFGYTAAPDDRAWRYHRQRGTRTVTFWYRESPSVIEPNAFFRENAYVNFPGMILPEDPPLRLSGESLLELDPQGRLQSLRVIPSDAATPEKAAPDWNALLAAAGLDPAALTPVPPMRMAVPFEHRAAWLRNAGKTTLRIEAASAGGKPVYFDIAPAVRPPFRPEPASIAVVSVFTAAILLTLFLVWRNIRLGRADLRGSARVALVTGCTAVLTWLFGADHVSTSAEVGSLVKALSLASFVSIGLWASYIALDPLFRRRWPRSMISWARLLAGNWRDPLVGRDVLAGSIGGAMSVAAMCGLPLVFAFLRGKPPVAIPFNDVSILNGTRQVVAEVATIFMRPIVDAVIWMAVLIVIRMIVRRDSLMALGYLAMQLLVFLPGAPDKAAAAIGITLDVLVVFVLLNYFGLLALVVRYQVDLLLSVMPVLWPPASWHSGITIAILVCVLGIAIFGFVTALGRHRIFSADLLEA